MKDDRGTFKIEDTRQGRIENPSPKESEDVKGNEMMLGKYLWHGQREIYVTDIAHREYLPLGNHRVPLPLSALVLAHVTSQLCSDVLITGHWADRGVGWHSLIPREQDQYSLCEVNVVACCVKGKC